MLRVLSTEALIVIECDETLSRRAGLGKELPTHLGHTFSTGSIIHHSAQHIVRITYSITYAFSAPKKSGTGDRPFRILMVGLTAPAPYSACNSSSSRTKSS